MSEQTTMLEWTLLGTGSWGGYRPDPAAKGEEWLRWLVSVGADGMFSVAPMPDPAGRGGVFDTLAGAKAWCEGEERKGADDAVTKL